MPAPLAGPPRSPGPPEAASTSGAERAAWALGAVGLVLLFVLHLVPGLVAGLLTHLLLRHLARHLTGWRVSHSLAKLLAAGAVATLVVLAMSLIILLVGAFVHGRWGGLPALLARMAQVVDETSVWLESRGAPALWPDEGRDASQLKEVITEWLRHHGEELRRAGGEVGRGILHAAVGIALGVMVFFRHPGQGQSGSLARALADQVRRFSEAFDTVVLAQVRISAINTVLTAFYLLAVLPLLGIHLPLRGTLVVLTFLTGLLPVLGNLLSNTVIVLISLGVAGWVAALSLAFLVVIHKLEYLVNARIVGARIDAAAWEILLALFAFEAAFGIPGVVLAPIVYADVKGQLRERGLV